MDELLADVGRIAWSQCWQVTLLVAGVWLVLRLVGRNRPHLACGLWLVVLLKCVTPPLVSSPSGIFCWMQREDSVEAEPTVLAAAAPEPAAAPAESAVVVQTSPAVAALPSLPAAAMPADLPLGRLEPAERGRTWRWSSLVRIGGLAWLAGAMMTAALALVRWRICWRKIRLSPPVESPELVALVQQLRQRLKLRRTVRLLITEVPLGPAVIGLWRPTIVLPAAVVRDKSPPELAPLIAHELIHIRRGDLWMGLLQTLAVAAWWFHPLVRLASRLVTREAERCCDEETIAHLGCEPAAYARSLLDVLALKQQLSPIPAFPGVRPVDVTSQRLERIMRLGQGCHKRTPWWCWLIMLAAAAAVLPGAAFVAAAREKSPPKVHDEQDDLWPEIPPADSAGDDAPKLRTVTYDVAEVLAAIGDELGASDQAARVLLQQLAESATGHTTQPKPGRTERAATWDDQKLVVRASDDAHRRIEEQLATLRQHGYAEVAVEVRIVSGPAAVLNAAGVNWRMIGGSRPSDDLSQPKAPARRSYLAPTGTLQSRIIAEEEPPLNDLRGTAESVVERQLPAMVALIDDARAKDLLDAAQEDRRSNVLQAPKVTLFNGQSARVEDSVQRPFVVGVTPVKQGDKTALQPKIRVFTEGTSIRLRPVAKKDGPIELDFGLTLSQIRNVETAEFPTGPGKEPITVQVPEVASTRLNTTVEMRNEQTLVLSIPKTSKGKQEQPPMCVLVKVRKLVGPDAKGEVAPQAQAPVPSPEVAAIAWEETPAGQVAPSPTYLRDDVQFFVFPAGPRGPVGKLIEKIYPVADLVIPVPAGPIKILPTGQIVKRESPAVAKPDFDSLIELIRTTIRPDSWDNVGGRGEISVATNNFSLVIRQEERVHEQIADLLSQLRRLQDVQVVLAVHRLAVPAAELERVAGQKPDSPLAPLVQSPKSRAWCLKPDSVAILKGLPHAKLQTGPKLTTFNGQSVDLWMEEGEHRPAGLLTRLVIESIVTADFRSLRLQVFGDATPPAENTSEAAPDDARTVLDMAIADRPPPPQLPRELRELPLGQVLVVDESRFAWEERQTAASAKKPDTRHFYLITPRVLVASEEEVLAPRKK